MDFSQLSLGLGNDLIRYVHSISLREDLPLEDHRGEWEIRLRDFYGLGELWGTRYDTFVGLLKRMTTQRLLAASSASPETSAEAMGSYVESMSLADNAGFELASWFSKVLGVPLVHIGFCARHIVSEFAQVLEGASGTRRISTQGFLASLQVFGKQLDTWSVSETSDPPEETVAARLGSLGEFSCLSVFASSRGLDNCDALAEFYSQNPEEYLSDLFDGGLPGEARLALGTLVAQFSGETLRKMRPSFIRAHRDPVSKSIKRLCIRTMPHAQKIFLSLSCMWMLRSRRVASVSWGDVTVCDAATFSERSSLVSAEDSFIIIFPKGKLSLRCLSEANHPFFVDTFSGSSYDEPCYAIANSRETLGIFLRGMSEAEDSRGISRWKSDVRLYRDNDLDELPRALRRKFFLSRFDLAARLLFSPRELSQGRPLSLAHLSDELVRNTLSETRSFSLRFSHFQRLIQEDLGDFVGRLEDLEEEFLDQVSPGFSSALGKRPARASPEHQGEQKEGEEPPTTPLRRPSKKFEEDIFATYHGVCVLRSWKEATEEEKKALYDFFLSRPGILSVTLGKGYSKAVMSAQSRKEAWELVVAPGDLEALCRVLGEYFRIHPEEFRVDTWEGIGVSDDVISLVMERAISSQYISRVTASLVSRRWASIAPAASRAVIFEQLRKEPHIALANVLVHLLASGELLGVSIEGRDANQQGFTVYASMHPRWGKMALVVSDLQGYEASLRLFPAGSEEGEIPVTLAQIAKTPHAQQFPLDLLDPGETRWNLMRAYSLWRKHLVELFAQLLSSKDPDWEPTVYLLPNVPRVIESIVGTPETQTNYILQMLFVNSLGTGARLEQLLGSKPQEALFNFVSAYPEHIFEVPWELHEMTLPTEHVQFSWGTRGQLEHHWQQPLMQIVPGTPLLDPEKFKFFMPYVSAQRFSLDLFRGLIRRDGNGFVEQIANLLSVDISEKSEPVPHGLVTKKTLIELTDVESAISLADFASENQGPGGRGAWMDVPQGVLQILGDHLVERMRDDFSIGIGLPGALTTEQQLGLLRIFLRECGLPEDPHEKRSLLVLLFIRYKLNPESFWRHIQTLRGSDDEREYLARLAPLLPKEVFQFVQMDWSYVRSTAILGGFRPSFAFILGSSLRPLINTILCALVWCLQIGALEFIEVTALHKNFPDMLLLPSTTLGKVFLGANRKLQVELPVGEALDRVLGAVDDLAPHYLRTLSLDFGLATEVLEIGPLVSSAGMKAPRSLLHFLGQMWLYDRMRMVLNIKPGRPEFNSRFGQHGISIIAGNEIEIAEKYEPRVKKVEIYAHEISEMLLLQSTQLIPTYQSLPMMIEACKLLVTS